MHLCAAIVGTLLCISSEPQVAQASVQFSPQLEGAIQRASDRERRELSVQNWELYQPSRRLTQYGPIASANGGDASGLGSEAAPSVLAGVENGLVARKHAIGEEVLAQILPDVFLCVELRALGRQR